MLQASSCDVLWGLFKTEVVIIKQESLKAHPGRWDGICTQLASQIFAFCWVSHPPWVLCSSGEENQLHHVSIGPQLLWKHRSNERSMRNTCSLQHAFVGFLEYVCGFVAPYEKQLSCPLSWPQAINSRRPDWQHRVCGWFNGNKACLSLRSCKCSHRMRQSYFLQECFSKSKCCAFFPAAAFSFVYVCVEL